MKFPDSLYMTPDCWGNETFFVTNNELRKMANSLTEAGLFASSKDAEQSVEHDVTELEIVKEIGDTAIYKGYPKDSRYAKLFLLKQDSPDEFELIEEYTNCRSFLLDFPELKDLACWRVQD